MVVIEWSDGRPRYGDCEPHRWRRRCKIAHIDIEGGDGGGRRAGMTMWGSAHHGKRTPKTRDLTVVRRQQWPRKDASVVAASPQKLTHDRTYIVLDVWKVREAMGRFGMSWAGRGRQHEVARRDVSRASAAPRRDFGTAFSNLHNALITCAPTTFAKEKKRYQIVINLEELQFGCPKPFLCERNRSTGPQFHADVLFLGLVLG